MLIGIVVELNRKLFSINSFNVPYFRAQVAKAKDEACGCLKLLIMQI